MNDDHDSGERRLTTDGRDRADDVAELIRIGGRLPTLPAEQMARIEQATYASWKGALARRSRRRRYWAFAGLATAAMLVVGVGIRVGWQSRSTLDPGASAVHARVVLNQVWIGEGPETESRSSIKIGDVIPVGSVLTTASDSRLALSMPTGPSVRLDSASHLRVVSGSVLDLESGAVYVDSGAGVPAGTLLIRTPLGEVRDVGTQFEVRLGTDASLRLRVREGAATLDGAMGHLSVAAGEELKVAHDGAVSRRASPRHGPGWDWIAGVTPLMQVEGRPLREFLQWVARERGWTLSFADEMTEARASAILLNGSIDGLTLDQALTAVLETSTLTHRVEDGVLKIE